MQHRPFTRMTSMKTLAAAAMRAAASLRRGPPSGAAPDWLKYVPAEVQGLLRPHLPGSARPAPEPEGTADSERFLSRQFTAEAGTRPYKLYVPSGYHGQAVPLVIMLHGCTQSPDDFAAGTRMNEAAEARTFIVAYPGQPRSAHPQKCWKWFNPEDQRRDHGEPSIIAGLTRRIMGEYAIDPRRVHVAGLSAGGALAAVMGEAYPELYAAVGVHSGLACGAASDLPSALAAMKRGTPEIRRARTGRIVPTIVFHGDRDTTVSPRNGEDVVARSLGNERLRVTEHQGRVPDGHAYRKRVHLNKAGQEMVEDWLVLGSAHAWSGGSGAGSYTDPSGPDATSEMLRFFQDHPHP